MFKVAKFGLTKAQRDKIAIEDFAKPPGGFPIDTQEHLNAAVKLLGKEPEAEQPAIKKRIIEIARRNKLALPKSWDDEGAKMGADEMSFNDLNSALRAALRRP